MTGGADASTPVFHPSSSADARTFEVRHGAALFAANCAGSTIFLPVIVEGALLCLGDCDAIQSDGEIGSVEMRSEVTLRCQVIKGRSPNMAWPRIETYDSLVTVGIATPLEEAARQALREMLGWIEELTGLSKHEAYLLAGCVGALRPGQVQVPNYSMRCIFPKQYLRERSMKSSGK